MKRPFYKVAMYSILFIQASNAFAQQAKVVTPFAAPAIVTTANPGTYQINTLDSSKIVESLLNRIGQVQDSDRQFIESTRTSIDASYNELVALIITGDFAQMVNKAQTSDSVKAEDYLRVLTKIREKQLALDSKIQSLDAITKGALPSQATIQVGDATQNVIGYRNIDLSKLVSFYQDKIQGLLAYANSQQIKINLPTGGVQIITENALTPKLKAPLYRPEDIESMEQKINELRVPSEDLNRLMDSQAAETRRLIQAFVTNYGSSERYRFKDESDIQARKEAYGAIRDIFWTRSYLRAKHGLRLGAIQPAAYQKRWANVEKFAILTESLRQFRQERAVTEVELADASENMRNVLELVDNRSADILGKNANASILVRANAFITWIGGQSQTAEALLMISQLIAADIAEEKMLTSAGGLAKVIEFYKTRYQSTDDAKKQTATMKCSMDTLLKNCPQDSRADVIANQGGLRQIFNQMNLGLAKMQKQLDQARVIEDSLKAALLADGDSSMDNVNDRADDL